MEIYVYLAEDLIWIYMDMKNGCIDIYGYWHGYQSGICKDMNDRYLCICWMKIYKYLEWMCMDIYGYTLKCTDIQHGYQI